MLSNSPIKEDFIHFLWRTKKVLSQPCETTDGRQLHILDYGIHNTDAGPDFFNGKIELDGTVWAGNIEMHVYSSDWRRHGHHQDHAYENVILHVVYEHDEEVVLPDLKTKIPTLELKGKIPKSYLDNYLNLIHSTSKIPCQGTIKTIPFEKIDLWKYTLTIERIGRKAEAVQDIMKWTHDDWEETLYIMLARYFGSKVNTEPFERLARSLPLSVINKNKDKRMTLDALLFGQAGMLFADYQDPYYLELKNEYAFQQKKYQLTPIDPMTWKFSRLRPMNFPTIRIAQFAGLMYRVTFLFSQIKEVEDIKDIRNMLASKVSEYWEDHYRFDKTSRHIPKNTGKSFIDLILINAIVPVLFEYGRTMQEETYINKAIAILEDIPSEKNVILDDWKSLGISSNSAFDSQALIQLKTSYCDHFRCMSCKIGNEIMNKPSTMG